MKPPTKEEEEMAEEIVDDGFGLQFDNKDPWSIQEALDVFLRGLAIFEACHKENIEIWTSWDINQRINIRDLVDNLNETLEWVSVIMFQDSVVINTPSERAENLYRAQRDLEEARNRYTIEKTEYEKTRKEVEAEIILRKRKIAVVEEILRQSLVIF
jgi:myo-inositol-1-phosphate synthase